MQLWPRVHHPSTAAPYSRTVRVCGCTVDQSTDFRMQASKSHRMVSGGMTQVRATGAEQLLVANQSNA